MNIRRLRLVTGLVLFTYLTTHFLNHALGLISLQAMEAGRIWFLFFWRSWPASTTLYSSLIIHLSLAFYALYRRQHLRMPLWEALQLSLGLTIPLMLIIHLVGTRVAHEWLAVNDLYAVIVLALWSDPLSAWRQTTLIVVAWLHGCIGLHFWLRLRPWYGRWALYFFGSGLLPQPAPLDRQLVRAGGHRIGELKIDLEALVHRIRAEQVEIGNGGMLGATDQYGNPAYYPYGSNGIYCKGAGAALQDDPTSQRQGAPLLALLRDREQPGRGSRDRARDGDGDHPERRLGGVTGFPIRHTCLTGSAMTRGRPGRGDQGRGS
jgi:hypothetical protein